MSNNSPQQPRNVPQVMVSSTYTDLKEHRAALIDAINRHGIHPKVMEYDSARPIDIIDSSLQMVRECAAYILLISHKYGQRPECPTRNPKGLSITELEFIEAQHLGRPIFLFIMSDQHPVKKADIDREPEVERMLNSFRERAKKTSPDSSVHRVYTTFNSLEEFKDKISSSLSDLVRLLNTTDRDIQTKALPIPANADSGGGHLREMESQLRHALEAFKGQPTIFVEPKLSKTREFNDEPNELQALMTTPSNTLIIAPPQFGLTCLGLHLQLEAFKKNSFWLYVDSEHTKARKICQLIKERLLLFDKTSSDLKCIILDSWDAATFDHVTMLNNIAAEYPELPLIILAEDSIAIDAAANLSQLGRDFQFLHLQALSRASMRQLVASYNAVKRIGSEDVVLSGIADHLESINVHRTALNCYTLLRVLDSNYNEKLVNKSKLLKAILFVLFTDTDSFSILTGKPEPEECSFVLGCFCKDLLKQGTRSFDAATFASKLTAICKSKFIVLNVDAMLNVLFENNILIKRGSEVEFKHRYWIFYFAAEWMRHDEEFRLFILKDRNYVNFPEVIEFYSGIDGKRADAMETLLSDLTTLINEVDKKIGIQGSFDPLSQLLWNPTNEYLQKTRTQIAQRVESSNLPADIKDKHADSHYQSTAPYDQSIRKFLKDYSVLSLIHNIKAASRALRSSPFVDVELKRKVTNAILQGWEEMSKVIFWVSPLLAKDGRATHDGLAFVLGEGFSADQEERLNEVITANLSNVVQFLGGDLASKKIGPLLEESFQATDSKLQKHMIALFIATIRPIGWREATLNYINLLHPRSFYLGKIFGRLTKEVTHGDLEPGEEVALKQLTGAIISKHEYAPRISGKGAKEIALNTVLSEENKLPIDQLMKVDRKSWPSP